MPKKTFFIIFAILSLFLAQKALAHQPRIVDGGDVIVKNPEVSQAFYDELKGQPRVYWIDWPNGFNLYLNLLVPKASNPQGRYSADVYFEQNGSSALLAQLKQEESQWSEFYEPFGADYYFKGPEFQGQVEPGRYRINIFNENNQGKYVLAIGQKEEFPVKEIIKTFWFLPRLKRDFFNTSLWTLLKSPLVLGLIIILIIFLEALLFIFLKIRKYRRKQSKLII